MIYDTRFFYLVGRVFFVGSHGGSMLAFGTGKHLGRY